MKTISTTFFAVALLLCGTGCFRVSSDTRALRDVALEFNENAEEKIEIGAGFFTVGLVKFGARFVELPPEAKTVLGSVHGVECSVYQLQSDSADHAKLLIEADKAMSKRGCDRIVGVIDENQLVAVYAPRDQSSHRNMAFSVMVLTGRELVCATARGDLEPVLQLAYAKSQEHLPKKRSSSTKI
ncbi:MAG TPA: hypothetical protein VF773_13520 [Verrucomicrobiae bacterium]